MAKITINGREYDTESLSDEAKQRLGSIQFVDRRINELRAELAAMQTARNAYTHALTSMLEKKE